MRKIVYLLFVAAVCLLVACSEEPVGQTPTNGDVPSSVTAPKVDNIAGGAIIYYTLPQQETDISYVRAEYQYKGSMKSSKSSVYKNFIQIEGFASTDPVEVKLYTVNHSEVSSEPVTVTINPLTPPVFNLTSSFKYEPDFGGLKVDWKNETGEEMVLTLMAYDEEMGRYMDKDAVYSAAKQGSYSFRGFESTLTRFGLYVRDKYYNISDTVTFELTPMYETAIKTDKFAHVMDIPADDMTALGGWGFEKMWDGIIGDQGWHSVYEGAAPAYFTWDLGTVVKLSRFTVWQRTNIPYINSNPKIFELWGATEYEKGKDENYWKKGGEWETDGHWIYLGTYEVKKPSGDGPDITNEDREVARNGHEFIVPLATKPIRYLRFGSQLNWSGGCGVHISEIKYWGDDSVKQ